MLILFRSSTCCSYAAWIPLVIWKEHVKRKTVWCLALLKKGLKIHLQSRLPIQIRDMEQTGALLHLKSLLKQAPCLVKRMRKISLICAEGKHHSPILGICFSQVVCKEQCSDDECFWQEPSIRALPSSEGERHRALLPAVKHFLSPSPESVMSHVWSLEGAAPWPVA